MQPNARVDDVNLFPNSFLRRRERLALERQYLPAIAPLLDRFEAINLDQMSAIALMDRVDTKYVIGLSQLHAVLITLVDDYRVLEVEGLRLSRYQTLYFDTENLDLYTNHHRGKLERFKVRSRTYLDSGVSFLEVKRKTNKRRTVKERIETETFLARLTPEASRFVEGVAPPINAASLRPTLWSEFSRVALVNERCHEKVTFDLGLRFRGGGGDISLAGLVIVEIKRESLARDSRLNMRMRELGIRPTPFSKYCVGMAILYPELEHNRFKPILRLVDHILRGEYDE